MFISKFCNAFLALFLSANKGDASKSERVEKTKNNVIVTCSGENIKGTTKESKTTTMNRAGNHLITIKLSALLIIIQRHPTGRLFTLCYI